LEKTAYIEINNLCKTYIKGKDPALDGLTLSINKGEIFGLLGPNGAGKTTTISILCNLIKPTKGYCKINGFNVEKEFNLIKPLIGVVSQEIAIYKSLTAYENLMYFGSMYGLSKKELKERIGYFLEKMNLTKFKNEKIDHFSGGMKRRVNLIAGVLHDPELVFLDEPTVGIDVQSRRVIIDYLKELNNEGVTLLYSSHMMDEAENLCSGIAVIDYGKLVVQGTPKCLIEQNDSKCKTLEDVFLQLTGRNVRDYF